MRAVIWVAIFAVVPAIARAEEGSFFESKIRPILLEHCASCHGPKKQQAGLRVDRRADFFQGSDDGPILVVGQPEKSRLVQALRHAGDIRMPPKGKLPVPVIADFEAWVKSGAFWPKDAEGVKTAAVKTTDHWAFKKPTSPGTSAAIPGGQTAIDVFLLAKLKEKNLFPNPLADRRTQLRRLKFDLLGLPVTEEEVRDFEQDKSKDAWEKRVDRYLASPHYGERWGRHWLDIARYADTKGYVFQEERRYAYSYTYRDWVIQALNDDLPYDQFILQQLAADRLVAKGQAPIQSQAAMGFLTLGRRFLNNTHDIIDDRIDVVSRGLLGLSVHCARCHDHKFDPIPTADYYSLYGVFASSKEPKDLPLIAEPADTPESKAFAEKLAELENVVAEFSKANAEKLKANDRSFLNKQRDLQKKVDEWKTTGPGSPARGMVLVESTTPHQPRVFLRGNPQNQGPTVPRQFLMALTPERKPFQEGSGRLEMAQAIASRDNPLTARVLVNRVWMHHFGAGLVATPSDFGLRGESPSHPELLDYLAKKFMDDGWSLKKLHRLMLLSNAYRQSSADNALAKAADPENRLLARANRHRLDFEALRDSLLFASGQLDVKPFGPGFDLMKTPIVPRRTVYGFIDRQNLPGLFRTFDFASPDATTGQRYQTTVPQQALFLLNSPFLLENARKLTERPELKEIDDPEAKIDRLYRLLFARPARMEEVRLASAFLQSAEDGDAAGGGLTAWQRLGQTLLLTNEFAFVD